MEFEEYWWKCKFESDSGKTERNLKERKEAQEVDKKLNLITPFFMRMFSSKNQAKKKKFLIFGPKLGRGFYNLNSKNMRKVSNLAK